MEQVKIPAHLAEKAQTSIDELFEKLVGSSLSCCQHRRLCRRL